MNYRAVNLINILMLNISYSSGRSSLNILQSSFPLSGGSNQLQQMKCDGCTNAHLIMGKICFENCLICYCVEAPHLFMND